MVVLGGSGGLLRGMAAVWLYMGGYGYIWSDMNAYGAYGYI